MAFFTLQRSFMNRELNPTPLFWADRTMSTLRANRLRACEKNLAGLPPICLFDPTCTDEDAELLYRMSWQREEEPFTELHTIKLLRQKTISSLPAELSLLTPEEHELMVRTVLLGGRLPLYNEDNYFPSCSLVRRLWGKVEKKGKLYVFSLSSEVCLASLLALASDEHRAVRTKIDEIFDNIDDSLYLSGALQVSTVLRDMLQSLEGTIPGIEPRLCLRSLKAGYDTMFSPEGTLMLFHPGLADPYLFFQEQKKITSWAGYSSETLTDAYNSLSEVEDPLYDRLLGLIRNLCRPEASADETLEDLIILAKQGASATDLREVLLSRIICLPSPEMLFILEEMVRRIPRWSSLRMGQVQ